MAIADTDNGSATPFAILSLDVGGTKIAGAVLHYESRHSKPSIILRRTTATDASRGGDAVLETLAQLACDLQQDSQLPLIGIGVGTAGCVDEESGSIAYANDLMPGWTGQPVKDALEKRTGLRTSVINDVRAHALGEVRWGAGRGAESCLVIAAGTGLGCTTVIDGRIIGGSNGSAGEIGYTRNPLLGPADGDSPACTLEDVASGSGIVACYERLTGEHLDGSVISQRAADGDEQARTVVEQAGYALGIALSIWTNLLDPSRAIVSGSVSKAGILWRDALHRGFVEHVPPALSKLSIVDAQLGGDAPLYGAAEHFIDSCGLEKARS